MGKLLLGQHWHRTERRTQGETWQAGGFGLLMMNNLRGMQVQHTVTEEEQQERVEKHKKFKPLSGILAEHTGERVSLWEK